MQKTYTQEVLRRYIMNLLQYYTFKHSIKTYDACKKEVKEIKIYFDFVCVFIS